MKTKLFLANIFSAVLLISNFNPMSAAVVPAWRAPSEKNQKLIDNLIETMPRTDNEPEKLMLFQQILATMTPMEINSGRYFQDIYHDAAPVVYLVARDGSCKALRLLLTHTSFNSTTLSSMGAMLGADILEAANQSPGTEKLELLLEHPGITPKMCTSVSSKLLYPSCIVPHAPERMLFYFTSKQHAPACWRMLQHNNIPYKIKADVLPTLAARLLQEKRAMHIIGLMYPGFDRRDFVLQSAIAKSYDPWPPHNQKKLVTALTTLLTEAISYQDVRTIQELCKEPLVRATLTSTAKTMCEKYKHPKTILSALQQFFHDAPNQASAQCPPAHSPDQARSK